MRYTLNVWQSGDASLTISNTPGRYRPIHELSLVNNGAGFDIHEANTHDMPLTTVQSLPAALSWAMKLTEPEQED